jgi:predicted membrane protein
MPVRLFRLLSILLFGWFVFVMGAVVYAKLLGRAPEPQEPEADEVDLVATFGPLDFTSTSQAFRGGAVTTWFGGGTVNLRDAKLAPEGATLRVQALFGGGNLIVPDDWRIETRVVGIGGAGDGRPGGNPEPGAPTLRVEGVALFGGWGISSEPAGDELAVA